MSHRGPILIVALLLSACGAETDYVTACPECRRSGLALTPGLVFHARADGVEVLAIEATEDARPPEPTAVLAPADAESCAAPEAKNVDGRVFVAFACYNGAGRGTYLCQLEPGAPPSCSRLTAGAGRARLALATDAAGARLLVAWTGRFEGAGEARLFAVRTDGTALPLWGPAPAHVPAQATWAQHDIAATAEGFVMVWVADAGQSAVQAIRIDPSGRVLGEPKNALAVADGALQGPLLVPVTGGPMLLVYTHTDAADGASRVRMTPLAPHGRLSADDGPALATRAAGDGGELAAYAAGALADGGFAVIGRHDSDGAQLTAQRFAPDGSIVESRDIGFALGRPATVASRVDETGALVVAFVAGAVPGTHLEPLRPDRLVIRTLDLR